MRERLPNCQYKYEIYPPSGIDYACPEKAKTNGKLCIFHERTLYGVIDKPTGLLHEDYDDSNPLAYPIELCDDCHYDTTRLQRHFMPYTLVSNF
jgi:hypothetical protein